MSKIEQDQAVSRVVWGLAVKTSAILVAVAALGSLVLQALQAAH